MVMQNFFMVKSNLNINEYAIASSHSEKLLGFTEESNQIDTLPRVVSDLSVE